MSNQTFNKARRLFLQGITSASALSITGFSSLAAAPKLTTSLEPVSELSGINVIQKTLFDRETVTLVNDSDTLQIIDKQQPISLTQENDILVVKVNHSSNTNNDAIVLSPNEQLTFDVKAVGLDVTEGPDIPVLTNLAQHELKITSEHPVFNRIVLVDLV